MPERLDAESVVKHLAFVHAQCSVLPLGKLSLKCRGLCIPGMPVARQVAVSELQGHSHVLVLDATGAVWSMGDNDFGGLGIADIQYVYSLQQIPGLCNASSVFASCSSSAAIQAGELWVWGSNAFSKLGCDVVVPAVPVPRRVMLPEPVAHVALSEEFMLVVTRDGCSVYGAGNNDCYQLGIPEKGVYPRLTRVPLKNTARVVKAAAGRYHSLLLLIDGWVLGSGMAIISGALSNISVLGSHYVSEFKRVFDQLLPVTDVQACNFSTALLCRNGHLYVCGFNAAWGHLYVPTKVADYCLDVVVSDFQVTAMNGVFFAAADGRRVGHFRSSSTYQGFRSKPCIAWLDERGSHVQSSVKRSFKFWACIC